MFVPKMSEETNNRKENEMRNEAQIMDGFKMDAVQAIIDRHGGTEALKASYISIENAPYMRLVIEWVGRGPYETDLVSVAHYYTQNGDAMRDPEMVFIVSKQGFWTPMTFQQDNLGLYQEAVSIRDGSFFIKAALIRDLQEFAKMWDRNIKSQGFLEAFTGP
jgi:hypothetical protein